MPGRRACDRCFKYKQKCNFYNDEEKCLECKLSISTCTDSQWRVLQARRPKIKNFGPQGSVQVWDAKSAPSRAVTITESNPNTLQMKRARDNRDALNQSDVARGVVSLQQLRTARIENVGDTLAIFALLCNSSTSILRYLLMSISPWYESVANNPTLDPAIFTSVSWDTLNCLVKRDVPMIKHISREAHIVDRLAGFVTQLLPILYDLCIASQRLEHHCGPGSGAELERSEKIQQEILVET
ncbi:uncharacterized protein RSE6_10774 [Rhynchosporium secalis]|uniref:Zn(2)-C6 fungal-type domain-containing protein n=1 Tax=Rhynchosporium secalis TaxID=38038 RepID=A0A1E1MLA7_RHYSE|nr:uncharacterized protein RSE6_10774 [Rhynchosporium secalis]